MADQNWGNFNNAMGAGGLLQGLLGLFGVGQGKNPADVANNYLNQIPGQTKPYYQPYMNAGTQSIDQLLKMLGQNPTESYNDAAKGYKESPGYKFALEQALGAGKNASSAGGSLGTPYSQQQAMETAQGVASKDFNDYIKNVLGIRSEQQSGLGNVAGIGANAANNYGSGIAQNLGQQAQYGYAGQAGQNQNNQGNWSNIFGSIPWFFAPL